jgi:hypothetical protein
MSNTPDEEEYYDEEEIQDQELYGEGGEDSHLDAYWESRFDPCDDYEY